MRQQLWPLYNRLRTAIRELTGEAEYERYRRGCVERRQPPLDRGRYFARRLEERYSTRSRCC